MQLLLHLRQDFNERTTCGYPFVTSKENTKWILFRASKNDSNEVSHKRAYVFWLSVDKDIEKTEKL